MARMRAIDHEDRLTLVEHLDELRSRIIVSIAAFGVALALCFWQDNLLLDIANDPLPAGFKKPTTLSPTEPFFTTMTIAAYGAALISLPVILYQAYAFIIPAFSPAEKRRMLPYLLAMPVLFVAGVVFTYFLVVPAATSFLLNFNEQNFDIQLRAKDYYSFLGILLLLMGLSFQMPLAMIAATRLGVVTPDQLARSRRYAIVALAVVAAAAPGGDPLSMMLILIPLVILYEGGIFLSRRLGVPKDLATGPPAPEGSG
jgi:sec-independent protein translocase protein TatC